MESVGHATQDVLDFAHAHADLQPGELAVGSGYAHDFAGVAAVSGFDDAGVGIGRCPGRGCIGAAAASGRARARAGEQRQGGGDCDATCFRRGHPSAP